MYINPASQMSLVDGQSLEYDEREDRENFEEFYEDIHEELSKFGELEELNVCENLGGHLMGNVYVKYRNEEMAQKAMENLNGRFYAGKPIFAELSPVTDFREGRCRQFDIGECGRGGFCNFMHLKKISRDMRKRLFGSSREDSGDRDRDPRDSRDHRERDREHSSRDRDRDRHSRDSRDHRDHRDRDRDYRDHRRDYRDRDRDRDRDYHRDPRDSRDHRDGHRDRDRDRSDRGDGYRKREREGETREREHYSASSSSSVGQQPPLPPVDVPQPPHPHSSSANDDYYYEDRKRTRTDSEYFENGSRNGNDTTGTTLPPPTYRGEPQGSDNVPPPREYREGEQYHQ